jgi:hypothetical protein
LKGQLGCVVMEKGFRKGLMKGFDERVYMLQMAVCHHTQQRPPGP